MPFSKPIDVTLMFKTLCNKVENMLSTASHTEQINVPEIDELAQELFYILNSENSVIATTCEDSPGEVAGFATVYEDENEHSTYLMLKVPDESIGVILWNPEHKGQLSLAPPHVVDTCIDMVEKEINKKPAR